jgi:hypothetical protein
LGKYLPPPDFLVKAAFLPCLLLWPAKTRYAMSVEIITKEDLQLFRRQLLEDLQQFLERKQAARAPKQVLKSAEVRRLLQISPATLQTLRVNGTLPYTKIGGTLYYRYEDIEGLIGGKGRKNQRGQ